MPVSDSIVVNELMRLGWNGKDANIYGTEYSVVSHRAAHHDNMTDVEMTYDMLTNMYNPTVRGFQRGFDKTLLFIRKDPNGMWYTTAIGVNPHRGDGSLMLVTTYKDKENPLNQLERILEDDRRRGAVASNPILRSFGNHVANVGTISDSASDPVEKSQKNDNFRSSIAAVPTTSDILDLLETREGREARNEEAERYAAGEPRLSIIKDRAEIDRLEAEPKVTGFRTVVLNEDGSYGSPMAGNLGQTSGRNPRTAKTGAFYKGQWEMAEENPDIADENGKIRLIKPKKKGVKLTDVNKVDYNPYIHLRLDKINQQFKDAWKRDDLVYIESEVPESEVKSEQPYQAEKAALPVGIHKWNGGNLMLSRYDKPFREVPCEEVA